MRLYQVKTERKVRILRQKGPQRSKLQMVKRSPKTRLLRLVRMQRSGRRRRLSAMITSRTKRRKGRGPKRPMAKWSKNKRRRRRLSSSPLAMKKWVEGFQTPKMPPHKEPFAWDHSEHSLPRLLIDQKRRTAFD